MTVAEMIEKLQTFSPDAEVYTILQGYNPLQGGYDLLEEVYEIKERKEHSGVFLEV